MYEEATSLLDRVVEMEEKMYGPHHSRVAAVLINQAAVLDSQVNISPRFPCDQSLILEMVSADAPNGK